MVREFDGKMVYGFWPSEMGEMGVTSADAMFTIQI